MRLDYAEKFLSVDLSQGISAGVRITAALSDLNPVEFPAHFLLVIRCKDDSPIVQQVGPVNLPLIHHCIVTDISILALVQLLQVELRQPDCLNPIFAASLVQLLAVHVLRQRHAS